MTRHDDFVRLQHMLEAADDAISFSAGRTRSDLDADRQFALALLKCIEIVGEAAARITEDTKMKSPEIPWSDIIGMRNRLIHGYFEIDLDLVWSTVRRDIPTLKGRLEPLIGHLRK